MIWGTGKSLSEALIFASTNPKYDDRLFIELQVHDMRFPSSNLDRKCVYRNCFWHSEQFLYTKCSPQVLQKEELLTKIYLYSRVCNSITHLITGRTIIWLALVTHTHLVMQTFGCFITCPHKVPPNAFSTSWRIWVSYVDKNRFIKCPLHFDGKFYHSSNIAQLGT